MSLRAIPLVPAKPSPAQLRRRRLNLAREVRAALDAIGEGPREPKVDRAWRAAHGALTKLVEAIGGDEG